MEDFPRVESYTIQVKLLSDFLAHIRRCKNELAGLDPAETQALCLQAASNAAGGSPAILLAADSGGSLFSLDLASAQLDCDPEKLKLRLSFGDRKEVAGNPSLLCELPAFRGMVRDAFGRENAFGRAMVRDAQPSGALVILPPAGRSFTAEEVGMLHPLTSQIDSLLEASEMFAALIHQSLVDEPTGLFNHRYLRTRLSAEISRASRYGHPLSIIFCKLDDFSVYLENNGRYAADRLVKDLAAFLNTRTRPEPGSFCFRASDVTFHYEVNKFAALLPETPRSGAIIKAGRLVKAVAGTSFIGGRAQPQGAITVSVGVATFPDDASDAVSMLDMADRALSAARKAGKNNVQGV
ncbi:MAG TPA: GGDEF domain-containing protein [Myxococcota bacterium]|nr:GGDEF domain-containing protein [Myxococcota bacterium]